MKELVRLPLFWLLYAAGCVYRTRGVTVIGYHSIDDSGSPISFGPAAFAQQMRFLRRHGYPVVPLRAVFDWLAGGKPVPENAVAITFDDGFASVRKHAWPVLQELKMPATVFVTTDYVGRTMTWSKVRGIPDLPMLTWDEIAELHRDGMDIQPHSGSHPFLSRLSDREIEEEVGRSADAIAHRLGRPCEVFCYPYGDFDERVIRALKARGFRGACAAMYGKVRRGDDPFHVRRIGVEHISGNNPVVKTLFFKASLRGAMIWYVGLKGWCPWLFHKPVVGE
jgi:peptidoglycan/xylan/chitin deacetylase (PgdA/CDA1 family)